MPPPPNAGDVLGEWKALRDDKSYPYIKVTLNEPYPRVYVTRRFQSDGARYFGPYTDVGAMRRALNVVKRIFTVRSCRYDMPAEMPERACLDWHIGRCKAPCIGLQSLEDYRAMIGDGFCDDGTTFAPNFNCGAFTNDRGDCSPIP
jgi:excinuclease UvrABC nuclease subunit